MAVKKDKIESFNLYGSRLQTKLNNIGQYGQNWTDTKLTKSGKIGQNWIIWTKTKLTKSDKIGQCGQN